MEFKTMDTIFGMKPLDRSLYFFLIRYKKKISWLKAAFFLIVSLALLSSCLPSRPPAGNAPATLYTEFKLGQLDPGDTGSGYTGGLSMGRRIDNRLWWGFEGLYFKSSYTQTTTVPDTILNGAVVSTKQVELDYSTTMLAFYINLSYERRFNQTSVFYYRASAGLGWEFIWHKENNYVDNVSRSRSFNTPGLYLTTGLGLGISQTGLIFADLVYNVGTAKTGTEATQGGLPTYDEISMTGFGFRVGINIWNLGFFRP